MLHLSSSYLKDSRLTKSKEAASLLLFILLRSANSSGWYPFRTILGRSTALKREYDKAGTNKRL